MNFKKALAAMLTAAMTLAMLTGCGSQAGAAASNDTAVAAGNTAEAETTDGNVEIEFFSTKTENADIMQKLVDNFMAENPEITVVLTSEADAGTVLKTRLTKDDIPEVIAMGGDSTYTELQGAGVLLDLSDESFVSNVHEAYLEMVYDVNADGEAKAYGIPYATNASGVLYNADLFAQAGVEVPATWTEFTKVVEDLEAAGIAPFELTFADAWTCLPPWNSMAPVIPDANFTTDRKAGNTTFAGTHEEVLEKYLWILSHAQEDFMGTSYNDGNVAFANGEAAMMINGNWAISEFMNTNPDLNVDMFAFPSVDDASKNTVTSGVDVLLAVSSEADEAQTAAAKKFVEYMLREDVAKEYIVDQFAFSAVKNVVQDDSKVATAGATIAEGRVSNFPDHYYPNGYDLSAILQQCSLDFVNGMDNAENIANTLASCDEQYDICNVE